MGKRIIVPDPYRVLAVDPGASPDEIRAAYHRLAREHHPDRSTAPESQARMVRINQAWELLSDPIRRAAVDRARIRTAASRAAVASPSTPATPGRSAGSVGSAAGNQSGAGNRAGAELREHVDAPPGPPPGSPGGSVLDFGRYSGWSMHEIARTDRHYLEWLVRTPVGRAYQAEITDLLAATRPEIYNRPRAAGRRGNRAPAT